MSGGLTGTLMSWSRQDGSGPKPRPRGHQISYRHYQWNRIRAIRWHRASCNHFHLHLHLHLEEYIYCDHHLEPKFATHMSSGQELAGCVGMTCMFGLHPVQEKAFFPVRCRSTIFLFWGCINSSKKESQYNSNRPAKTSLQTIAEMEAGESHSHCPKYKNENAFPRRRFSRFYLRNTFTTASEFTTIHNIVLLMHFLCLPVSSIVCPDPPHSNVFSQVPCIWYARFHQAFNNQALDRSPPIEEVPNQWRVWSVKNTNLTRFSKYCGLRKASSRIRDHRTLLSWILQGSCSPRCLKWTWMLGTMHNLIHRISFFTSCERSQHYGNTGPKHESQFSKGLFVRSTEARC